MTCEYQMVKCSKVWGQKLKRLYRHMSVAVLCRLSTSSDTDHNDLEDLQNCSRSDKYPGLIPLIDL